MKVCLVAAPLMARSGVYQSAIDLVTSARARGLDWSALLAVRPDAAGSRRPADGVDESTISSRNGTLLRDIRLRVRTCPAAAEADVLITLVPQSDIAVAGMLGLEAQHVAWVRGLPWPGVGEQGGLRRILLTELEVRALRRADDVWATSPILAASVERAREPVIVPAGLSSPEAPPARADAAGPVTWAGRLDREKGVREFVEIAQLLAHPTRIHGHGPLETWARANAPASLHFAGWSEPAQLWRGASMFVSTSRREAFGRCAVEAARAGLPLVLSDQVGAAPLLVTDAELRDRFVLPLGQTGRWLESITSLLRDAGLRQRLGEHVALNARSLTVDASLDAALERLGGGPMLSTGQAL